MTVAIAVAAGLLLCALVLAWRPVRVSASLQAMASGDGAWAAAGGGAIGPLALTAGARQGGATWSAHLFGRELARARSLPRVRRPRRLSTLRLARVALRSLRALRRVRIDSLDAHVRLGLDDPAAMGKVAGWLSVASATLAPVARIDTEYDWMAEEPGVALRCEVRARVVPMLFGWDLLRATLRSRTSSRAHRHGN